MAEYDPSSQPEHYFGGYHWERHFVTKADGVSRVSELARRDFDVFVNLCDGAWDEDRPGIEILYGRPTPSWTEPWVRERFRRIWLEE